jgi:very-short-patch-repair endonuclease
MSVPRAQTLRKNSSPIERRMWRILFAFRTHGYHFRKQVPIGPYVVDMACHHARLVIEVDGDTHGTEAAQKQDARRDAFLRSQGYAVLRILNSDGFHNPNGVFLAMEAALEGRPLNRRVGHPLPNPSHKGEGESTESSAEGEPGALSGTSPLVGEVGRGDSDAR